MIEFVRTMRRCSNGTIGAVIVAFALVTVGICSRFALWSVFLDGMAAAVVVIPALGLGLGLVPLLRLGRMPIRWHLLCGAALGLGVTSLTILGLGLAGFLQRELWIGFAVFSTVVGVVRLRTLLRSADGETGQGAVDAPSRWLWLLMAPFLAMALLAASNAPGFIWSEEGFGYDVLEYHLALPKEYLQAGRIHYTPHNVYGNFPANVEMLYLLAMILTKEPVEAGTACNMIHLFLGALSVFAAWTIARDWSCRCGLISGLLLGTCGWCVYLSGLAYVELGMLFFGFAAVGGFLKALPGSQSARVGLQPPWLVFSGMCAGFACGCKYTAAAMIAAPIGVGLLATIVADRIRFRDRAGEGALRNAAAGAMWFVLACAVGWGPWVAKNAVMTGNPVFPLANSWFRAMPSGWGEEEQQRWDKGHAPTASESGLSGRVATMWRHIPADKYQRFGPMLFILGIAALVLRALHRDDRLLLLMLLIQLLVWLLATHLFARFAVVILIPLALLAGRAGLSLGGSAAGWLVLGALWTGVFAGRLLRAESPMGAPASLIYSGEVPGYEFYGAMNKLGPADKVLLVGESRAFYVRGPAEYTVVFNHHALADLLSRSPSVHELRDWLVSRGFTHVFVNGHEIRRLQRTYGFPPALSAEALHAYVPGALKVVSGFRHMLREDPYAVLYSVVRD